MKKSGFILPILLVAFACNSSKQTTKIEIAQGISISVPQESNKIKTDTTDFFYKWETSFEDDHFGVYRYPFIQSDTLGNYYKKQIFRKNINGFLQAFNYKNIDSTFQYNDNLLQCNMYFDFLLDDTDFRLFGRFLLNKDYFIAFVFQTPFPVDRFSKSLKDKLLNSIEIK
jgi:hypothetical protein